MFLLRHNQKTGELCTLQVAWKTPLEKLDALVKCLNEWLSTEENRWYEPNTSVTLQKIEFQRYLEITIGIPHNSFVFLFPCVAGRCADLNTVIGKTGAFAIPAKLLSTSLPIIIADSLV